MSAPTITRPVFRGVYQLLTVIEELCHRQAFWYRARADEDRGEIPLPLICLVRQPGSDDFLPALSDKLNEVHARDIPQVYIDAEAPHSGRSDFEYEQHPGGVPSLLPLLDRIRTELNHRGYGGRRLTRFNRYRLADWLTRQRIRPDVRRDDRVGILRLLRQWISKGRQHPDIEADAGGANFWLWLLVHITPMFWFWVWSRSREVRWFMSQDYMTAHSPNFLGLAERLTLGHRPSVSVDEIKKLLVHAFLEDLRVAYHRRLFPFRARRWRRTAHTVVLLDNVTDANGGWELLHLINDIRNETGDPDPLLVVAASDEPPPYSGEAGLPLVKPDRITYALDRWRQDLPSRRQKKERFARYLSISLPTPANAEPDSRRRRGPEHDRSDNLLPEDEYAWYQVTFQPRRPALLARQYVMSPLVALIMVSSVSIGGWAFLPQIRSGCFPFGVDGFHMPGISEIAPPDLDGIEVRPVLIDGKWECVGYSDNKAQVFGTNQRLRTVQNFIFEENSKAEQRSEASAEIPLVSIVYFAGLTQPQHDDATYSALSEELEGLLILQRELVRNESPDLLLRVIVANGGSYMKESRYVADRMITPLIHSDFSVIGVVGMDRTTADTEAAIALLGRRGIPTIATTLTGTGLSKKSPLYFQLAPANDTQAKLVEQYVNRGDGPGRKITVYHPTSETDSYVNTLVAEIDEEFKPNPAKLTWSPGHPHQLDPHCDNPGGTDQVAFYAGRAADFVGFLQRMVAECPDALPDIVGDDATTRFFAQRGSRTHDQFFGLRVSYVALGARLVLTGGKCMHPPKNGVISANGIVNGFCAGYRSLHADLRAIFGKEIFNPFPAARTGLAYDAANLLLSAVRKLNQDYPPGDGEASVPSLPMLVHQLDKTKYNGVTGTIEFGESRIAKNQALGIFEFKDIHEVESDPECVQAVGDFQGPVDDTTGCPPSPGSK